MDGSEVAMTDNRPGGATERSGYVYVLATAFTNKADLPIIKIGRTSRTPSERNNELSRGGPVGMKLVGAVTTRDAIALEQKAHRAFTSARFIGDGGTEYFTANPDEVLAWLRAEAPRFEIDSARNSAWHEYVESPPWKARANASFSGFSTFMIVWFVGSFLILGAGLMWMLLVMPFIAGAIAFWVWHSRMQALPKNIDSELKSIQRRLEEKYNLPVDTLLSGPTAGYKHNAPL